MDATGAGRLPDDRLEGLFTVFRSETSLAFYGARGPAICRSWQRVLPGMVACPGC